MTNLATEIPDRLQGFDILPISCVYKQDANPVYSADSVSLIGLTSRPLDILFGLKLLNVYTGLTEIKLVTYFYKSFAVASADSATPPVNADATAEAVISTPAVNAQASIRWPADYRHYEAARFAIILTGAHVSGAANAYAFMVYPTHRMDGG